MEPGVELISSKSKAPAFFACAFSFLYGHGPHSEVSLTVSIHLVGVLW